MTDMLIGKDGDILLTEDGDIVLTESIRQRVLIRLRWILNEWKFGPALGFPWFEEVLVKGPNIPKIQARLREEVMKVEGVTGCTVTEAEFDRRLRSARFRFVFTAGKETFTEEVALRA